MISITRKDPDGSNLNKSNNHTHKKTHKDKDRDNYIHAHAQTNGQEKARDNYAIPIKSHEASLKMRPWSTRPRTQTPSRTHMVLGLVRISVMFIGVAIALFIIHHQLQILYFRTCRANLLAVVLHQRSDICYGMELAISMIERGYQHGIAAIMQLGVSSCAFLLPYLVSSTRAWTSATRQRPSSTSQSQSSSHPSYSSHSSDPSYSSSWWPFPPLQKRKRRFLASKFVSWRHVKT